ncbi:hypothetical protein T459_27139 [Capsicum annuum]|uniref:G3BP-like protein n=1 Tax=Capsicum annuum TaxID=4072 RepID=A0A2G2YD30_CAPAN|nr:hypothetical protein T459_27139 [Capsicum annuum]
MEVTTIDSPSSTAGGVLVVVTGCLIGQDASRKNFSQTFFLTPQETGYYVLNDIFRFISVEKSSTIIEEKVDENPPIAPLAIENKAENTVATSQKEEQVLVKTTPIIANEAPKVSYALMIKQGRPSSPTNTPHKIVNVAVNAGLPTTPKRTQANSFVQALISSSGGVEKVAAPPTNVAQDNYDDVQHKSIYIGGLSSNTTRSDLHAVVKEFGPVRIHDVQLKTYEDGYCCGFVHFQDAISVQNAVQNHHIIVNGKEAYMRFKRPNKGRVEIANSPSDTEEKERKQILFVSPLPSINQAYAMVISDESQKSVGATAGILGSNLATTRKRAGSGESANATCNNEVENAGHMIQTTHSVRIQDPSTTTVVKSMVEGFAQ